MRAESMQTVTWFGSTHKKVSHAGPKSMLQDSDKYFTTKTSIIHTFIIATTEEPHGAETPAALPHSAIAYPGPVCIHDLPRPLRSYAALPGAVMRMLFLAVGCAVAGHNGGDGLRVLVCAARSSPCTGPRHHEPCAVRKRWCIPS